MRRINNTALRKDRKLNSLKKIMEKSGIPESYYSIGSYIEEAVCIEKGKSFWYIYEGERGKRYNPKFYRHFRRACYDFFARVSESDRQEMTLKKLFDMEQRKIAYLQPAIKKGAREVLIEHGKFKIRH